MKILTCILVAVLLPLANVSCSSIAPGGTVLVANLSRFEHVATNRMVWCGTIAVSSAVSFPARIEISANGNGYLEFDRFTVHVYDAHDNGYVYSPPLLHILVTDADADGFNDVLVFGERHRTGDAGNDVNDDRSTVAIFFRFDPETRHFVVSSATGRSNHQSDIERDYIETE